MVWKENIILLMFGGSKNTPTNNAWAILTPFVCGMAATLKLEPQTALYLSTGFIAFVLGLIYLLMKTG